MMDERGKEISKALVIIHIGSACVLSTVLHGLLAGSLDFSAFEVLRVLAAHDGERHAAGSPLSTLLVALGVAIGGGEVLFVRLPTMFLWLLLPLLAALACQRASGRGAAVKAAWLVSAMPMIHLVGVFAGPGLFLALAYGGAALILVTVFRRSAGSQADAEQPSGGFRWIDGLGLGAVGVVAVLSAPCGWLLPIAIILALVVSSVWETKSLLVVSLLTLALPIVALIIAVLALGDLRWALPTTPTLDIVNVGEVIPPSRLPILGLALLLGVGPLVFVPLGSWAHWAIRSSPAGPRRAARALLILGAFPVLALLLVSVFMAVDPVNVAAPLIPLLIGLVAWKGLDRWFLPVALSSGVVTVFAFVQLLGVVSVLPEEMDPGPRLRGWAEVGEGVEVWCNIVPEEGATRVIAEPALAARLVISASSCEPIAFAGGPSGMKRSEVIPGGVFLLVHGAGAPPKVPPACAPGAHAAPVGPPELGIVVRPSRCGERE